MNWKQALSTTVIAFSALALGACSGERQQLPPTVPTVHNLSVLAARQSSVPDLLEASGTLRAVQTSILASQVMGNIVEIRVREGDRVQRGQVLAVIDDTQSRAAVERANAATHAAQQELVAADSGLTLADATLKRYQTLFDRKSVSPQEFDEVKARYQAALARRDVARADKAQAEAALAQATTVMGYTRIRAPFDGVITEKRADPGVLATPGMPILTLEDVRRFRLEATINESDLAYLRLGQALPVRIDSLGDTEMNGKLAQIVPAADPASRSFLIKIELPPDARLRSGLFGRAQFSHGQRESILIPKSAVVERGQLQAVFVLDQNQVAALRYVTLGKSSQDRVEVLAGLQNGERLVVQPGDRELDGKRIEAQP